MSQPGLQNVWRHASGEEVLDSFASNTIVLDINGVKCAVSTGNDALQEHPIPTGFIVSAVFGPVTTVWDRLLADRDWLLEDFEHHWLRSMSAWCVDVNRSWVEPAIFVDELLHDVAVGDFTSRFFAHCQRRGIAHVVKLEGSQISVISVRTQEVLLTRNVEVRPLDERCRMNDGEQVCEVYGGPWTSASRAAASTWFQRRSKLVAAFGCELCSGDRYFMNGHEYSGNPIISIITPSVPTRWMHAVSG